MKLIKYPERKDWPTLLQRPAFDSLELNKKVRKILDKVKKGGDKAVKKFTKEFDEVKIKNLLVSEAEIQEGVNAVPDELKQAIRTAKNNIEKFHQAQVQTTEVIETMPGVKCWRKAVAIDKVGLYIPGG